MILILRRKVLKKLSSVETCLVEMKSCNKFTTKDKSIFYENYLNIKPVPFLDLLLYSSWVQVILQKLGQFLKYHAPLCTIKPVSFAIDI